MTQTTPNKSKIAASLSLILGTALSSGVMSSATAQETEKDIEVIQVSGIRSSVQESMGIKRDSAGVVASFVLSFPLHPANTSAIVTINKNNFFI